MPGWPRCRGCLRLRRGLRGGLGREAFGRLPGQGWLRCPNVPLAHTRVLALKRESGVIGTIWA